MTHRPSASEPDQSPPPGQYLVPNRAGGCVERGWDGQAWTSELVAAAPEAAIPHYKRHWLRLLSFPGWVLLAVFVLASVVATVAGKQPPLGLSGAALLIVPVVLVAVTFGVLFALAEILAGRRPVSAAAGHGAIGAAAIFIVLLIMGLLGPVLDPMNFSRMSSWIGGEIATGWLAAPATMTAAAAALGAFLLLFQRRLRFDQLADPWNVALWGVIAGACAEVMQLLIAYVTPDVAQTGLATVGVREEVSKLLLPVVLWFVGRFRAPREGFLLVFVSASTFGIVEAAEYASKAPFSVGRPLTELVHPLITCFVAAVAWRAAVGKRNWFTWPAIGALILGVVVHSGYDLAGTDKYLLAVPWLIVIAMYFALKYATRQLVPPNMVASVAPWWRPSARLARSTQPAGQPTS